MSTLEPLLPTPEIFDPSVTRLLRRQADSARVSTLLQRATAVRPSVSAVLTGPGPLNDSLVNAVSAWQSTGARIEVFAFQSSDLASSGAAHERLQRSDVEHQVFSEAPGGQLLGIARAVEQSDHEFVVLASATSDSLGFLDQCLAQMWVDGADVAVLQPNPLTDLATTAVQSIDNPIDAGTQLARWIASSGSSDSAIVMRRWVARWLFNEIARAIDPVEEIADRARLLGVAIAAIGAEPQS
ncbi:MAG: hypothetical protein WCJ04_13240 [Actinomycetes bacterium]